MKKFYLTIILYLLLLSLTVVAANGVYIALDKSDGDHTRKFQSVPKDITICNFGGSHGLYGFNYEDVDSSLYETCFNFALDSQSLSYDQRIMTNYYDDLKDGGTAFLVVSYPSLFGKGELASSSFESKNKRYYKFLPKDLIKEYSVKTAFYQEFPALSAGTNLLLVFLGKSEDTTDKTWMRTADMINITEDAEKACERHIFTNKFNEEGERILNKEEINALYRMIELCKSKKIRPILITTPYLNEYIEEVRKSDPAFFPQFSELIQTIQLDTGVEYYDYSMDSRFSNEHSLFMNADHLNKEGARIFTNALMKEVLGKDVMQ